MQQPRHIYTLTTSEVKRYTEFVRETGQFAVVHEHVKTKPCWGDCLMLNIPDEVESQLQFEV